MKKNKSVPILPEHRTQNTEHISAPLPEHRTRNTEHISASVHHPDSIIWSNRHVDRSQREHLLGQKGIVLWLTGLSGSGKSTIAVEVEKRLVAIGKLCYRLDGDNLRHGLNSDLGFSADERRASERCSCVHHLQ